MNELSSLLAEFPNKKKEDILEIYRNAEYNAEKVRQHLKPHNKFLVSYDLMPDGSVQNYQELPIE